MKKNSNKKFFKEQRKKKIRNEKREAILANIIATNKHFAFARPKGEGKSKDKDIFISSDKLNGAMDGDLVYCKITKKAINSSKQEGKVVKIIERANKKIVGTLSIHKSNAFLIPANTSLKKDIFIREEDLNGAKDKQVVVAEILSWGEPNGKRRLPEGKIVEIIGNKNQKGVDIVSIIRNNKIRDGFNKKVYKEASAVPKSVPKPDIKGRIDFRNKNVISIDGKDSKDLDDAIYLEIDKDGNYKLSVHIADVTHYVKEGSKIDKEAFKRGNSVYLVDRVIPMLPVELSNGICSLNEGVDRLTLSVEMIINPKGKVLSYKIFEAVINNKARLTYDKVSEIIDSGKINNELDLSEDIQSMLFNMKKLSDVLEKNREKKGELNFNFTEAYVELDKNGYPVAIKPRLRGSSDIIIEQFMITTNEVVAEHALKKKLPFVYRIHELPDLEKIETLNRYMSATGHKIKFEEDEIKPIEVQNLMKKLKGSPEEKIINKMLLRSLKQARYSSECSGHFGLASSYYSHFTSPIRRYADLQIHRILKMDMHGNFKKEDFKKYESIIEEVCLTTSETERNAEQAERECLDLKKCQYMENRIGEEYKARISSITNFGIYSELENTVEGFTHISDLDDDYYIFDEARLSLVGEHSSRVFKIGDEVNVVVESVDVDERHINFSIYKQ